MSRVITFQACRHGIGCSHLVANVAVILLQRGYRVGILDRDPNQEGVRTLLGLEREEMSPTANGAWCFLSNLPSDQSLVSEFKPYGAITDLDTPTIYLPATGNQWLPEGNQLDALKTHFGEGKSYEVVQSMSDALNLDFVLIDNQPEITDENLLGLALADIAVVLLQLDNYELQRAAVLLEVIEQLEVVKTLLVPTLVLPTIEPSVVVPMLNNTYHHPVAGVLYLTAELVTLASQGVFCLYFPNHPLTQTFEEIALQIEQDAIRYVSLKSRSRVNQTQENEDR